MSNHFHNSSFYSFFFFLSCLLTFNLPIYLLTETHPSCNHCTRLNLKCSYEIVYRWDEEALQNGTTFGRSNQYKKSTLCTKFEDYISRNEKEDHKQIDNSTYDYFLKSETSTLSQEITKQNIPWVNTKHNVHFINATHYDFTKGKKSSTDNHSLQKRVAYSPLMQVLSSMLVDDYFLNFIENNVNESPVLEKYNDISSNHNSSIKQIQDIEQIQELKQDKILDLFTPSYPDIIEGISPVFLDSFSPASPTFNTNFDIPLNLNFSLPNLTLQSNNYYAKYNTLCLEQQKLLSYFIENICPTCVCYSELKKSSFEINPIYFIDDSIPESQSDMNPYLYLIVPLAFKHEIVMDAVIATSAYQLYLSDKDPSFKLLSDAYADKAVKKLPDLIREKQCQHSSDWDEVLATVLMLCFREISANSDSRLTWMMYLSYAKYFVKEINSLNVSSALGTFFARYFITHEVIGQTVLLEDEEFNIQNNNSNVVSVYLNLVGNKKDDFMKYILQDNVNGDLHLRTLKDRDTVINVVFGCCPYLICLTHQISSLAECCEGLEFETLETKREFLKHISARRRLIKFDIQNIEQKLHISEVVSTNRSEKIIEQIAEIRRLSVLLYLFIRIDLEELYQNGGIITKDFIDKRKEMEKYKSKAIELYNLLPEIPVTLTWSIFILGVILSNYENERWFILEKLTQIQSKRESLSLKNAKDVIIEIWKDVDLGLTSYRWKDLINEKADSLSIALIN